MKKILDTNPTFNASAKTLDFSAVSGFNFQKLYAVVNQTRNTLIYAVGTSGFGGSLSGSIVTLDYNTTTHANNDLLICVVDDNTINIGNFPSTQPVSGTVAFSNTSINVGNFPSSFSVSNFPSSFAISNFPTTQPISAVSLPLPTGASTEATLALIKAKTDNLTSNPALETGGNLATLAGKDFATQTTLSALNAKFSPLGQTTMSASQPVVLSSNHSNIPFNLTKIQGIDPSAYNGSGGSTNTLQVGLTGNSYYSTMHNGSMTAASGTTSFDGYSNGVSQSYLITCSALSGGSSPYIDLILCESIDNGSNFKDIYHIERISAVNSSNPIWLKNIPTNGKMFFRWVTGGSPSTATVNIKTTFGSGTAVNQVKYFDRTSGLLAGTLNNTSSTYNIQGCSIINVSAYFSAISSPAIYSIQVSDDATNWQTKTTLTPIAGVNDISLSNIVANYIRILCSNGVVGSQTGVHFCIKGQQGGGVDIGTPNDSSASSDTGIFSFFAFFKRLLSKIPALGQALMSASFPVAIASNQNTINVKTDGSNFVETNLNVSYYPLAVKPITGAQQLLQINPYTNYLNYDQSSTNVKTTGTGTKVQTNSGISCSFYVQLTALSGGSSPSIDFVLKESYDNGFTYRDIYHVPRMTATGSILIPAIPMRGVRRWDWTTNGSPTTATATIIATELNDIYPIKNQFFDRTSGLIAGTLNSSSSIYDIEGCTQLNISLYCNSVTSGAVYQTYISQDNSNWIAKGSTFTAIAGGVDITLTNIITKYIKVVCITGGTQIGNYLCITGQQ